MQCNATKVKCVHSSWLCNQPNAFLPPPPSLSSSPLCSPILPVSQLYHQDYPHLSGELRGGRTETLVEVQSKDSRPDVCTICTLVHWMHRYVCTICILVHLMHTHTHTFSQIHLQFIARCTSVVLSTPPVVKKTELKWSMYTVYGVCTMYSFNCAVNKWRIWDNVPASEDTDRQCAMCTSKCIVTILLYQQASNVAAMQGYCSGEQGEDRDRQGRQGPRVKVSGSRGGQLHCWPVYHQSIFLKTHPKTHPYHHHHHYSYPCQCQQHPI